jgi:hypothetical protein
VPVSLAIKSPLKDRHTWNASPSLPLQYEVLFAPDPQAALCTITGLHKAEMIGFSRKSAVSEFKEVLAG